MSDQTSNGQGSFRPNVDFSTINISGLSAGMVGGPGKAVQFNNGAGGFGGEAAFNYDSVTNVLGVTNIVATQYRSNTTLAATTPGSVVKKLEIFDATGVSLGFIPIYDAIT